MSPDNWIFILIFLGFWAQTGYQMRTILNRMLDIEDQVAQVIKAQANFVPAVNTIDGTLTTVRNEIDLLLKVREDHALILKEHQQTHLVLSRIETLLEFLQDPSGNTEP